MFQPSSPVSGVALTGFTSPTFTLVQDTSVPSNMRQYYVSARGGTQGNDAGHVHSVNKPFTVSFSRPQSLAVNEPSIATSLIKRKGNQFKLITRIADSINSVGGARVNIITTTFDIDPATGTTSSGLDDLRGALSLHGAIVGNATNMEQLIDSINNGTT